MASVEIALEVGGGAGDGMGVGVGDGLGGGSARSLEPALRAGEGVGRTGLRSEMALGMKDWVLVLTAGWVSVVLGALTM